MIISPLIPLIMGIISTFAQLYQSLLYSKSLDCLVIMGCIQSKAEYEQDTSDVIFQKPRHKGHENLSFLGVWSKVIYAYCSLMDKEYNLLIPNDSIEIICYFAHELKRDEALVINYKISPKKVFTYNYAYTVNKLLQSERIEFEQKSDADEHETEYKHIEQRKIKLLILGAGLTGKSTILKQLRRIYGRQYDKNELLAAKPQLTANTIEAMRTLAIYSSVLNDQGKKECRVSDELNQIRKRVSRMSHKQKFTLEHYNDFVKLWFDDGIRNVLKYQNQFIVGRNCERFFRNMAKYYDDDYIPTFEDLVSLTQRTTGVNKIKFVISDTCSYTEELYDIFDVGGMKNERRRWMLFFEDTAGVLFVVGLDGFNKLLWEDNRNNRLREDIGLFRGLINLAAFDDAKVFVVLNRFDLFVKDVEDGYKFSEYFKSFDGDDRNVQEIVEHIINQILDQRRKPRNSREIYFIVTNSLNTKCIKDMFEYVRLTLITSKMSNAWFHEKFI